MTFEEERRTRPTSTIRGTALLAIGRRLAASDYQFVTVTPATHRRVLERDAREARDLRDVFGWNRVFEPALVGRELYDLLRAADALEQTAGGIRSRVRFSTLGHHLFVHSAFPTKEKNAVFFGPDTYRFCCAIERLARPASKSARVLDLGCGAGAGAVSASKYVGQLVLADINDEALLYAKINSQLAGLTADVVQSDGMGSVAGSFELIVANPPFISDAGGPTYRNGGGKHGEALATRFVREAVDRLVPGGTLLLYTGAAIVSGNDVFRESLLPVLGTFAGGVRYEEIDPDIFGEELDSRPYADVDRIAAVVLTATRT